MPPTTASRWSKSNTNRFRRHRPVQGNGRRCAVLREDIKDKKEGAHGRASTQPHFRVGVGDKDLTDAAFRKAEVTVKEMISYIAPIRRRWRLASGLLVRQDQGRTDDLGHVPGAACDPHVVALIAKFRSTRSM